MAKKKLARALNKSAKKTLKAPPKKSRKRKSFSISVSGDQIGYFINMPTKSELLKLRGKGIRTENGLMTLPETLSGDEEITWVSPMHVMATANGKVIPINRRENIDEPLIQDFRQKNVVFVENTTDNAEYHSQVYARSIDEIRIDIWHSERWILPNGKAIDIYVLEIVSPRSSGLEYQNGGGGYIQGELITTDGKSYELNGEGDEETGETLVTAS